MSSLTFRRAFRGSSLRTFLRLELFSLIGSFLLLGRWRDLHFAHVAVVVDDFLGKGWIEIGLDK